MLYALGYLHSKTWKSCNLEPMLLLERGNIATHNIYWLKRENDFKF